MDIHNDEPKLSVDTSRRTTQLNIYMVLFILLFFVIAGIWVFRVFRDPPSSTEEMKQGLRSPRLVWSGKLC
jgi:hypothetical protein